MECLYNSLWSCLSTITSIPKLFASDLQTTERVIIKETVPLSPFVRLAGLSGCLAVGLGAYGAHALKDHDPEVKYVFDTAYRIHLVHSVVLLSTPFARHSYVAAGTLSMGLLMFAGPCYLHAFTGRKDLQWLVPMGGATIMLSWLVIAL